MRTAFTMSVWVCVLQPAPSMAEPLSFLTSDGARFVNARGEPAILKGCNIGSWLNLEMWMLDVSDDVQYPDQYTVERVLEERFGRQEKDRLLDVHRASWITERDFQIIQSLGFNCIRVPFHYNLIEDDANPMQVKDGAWIWFDRIIELCNRYQLYVILDLHAAAGCQNAFDHSGRREWNKLWTDRNYWERTAWLWEQIAQRYSDCPTIAAYQPINEPWGGTLDQQVELFDYLHQAIRKHDDRHVIIASAHFTGFDHLGDPRQHGWRHVGYSQNFYPGLFGGGSIRPETHRKHLDWLDSWLKPRLDELNIPFLVTEFNVVFNAAGNGPMMRRHFDAYAKHGWAATMWSYKLITSPGKKNTGGWWLLTETGQAQTGAWWIVTNKTPLPPVDFRTASQKEIEGWFRSFSTVEYQLNEGLHKALTAPQSPGPIEPAPITTLTVPPAHDELPGWIAVDVNDAKAGGQKRVAEDAIELYASGADVWGKEDQFRFVYQETAGDFVITTRVEGLTFTDTYAKAGLMIRQSLDKDAAFVSVDTLPDGVVEFAARPARGLDAWSKHVLGPEFPNIRLKLERRGNVIKRYFASGGEWDPFDEISLGNPGDRVYVGLFSTSHDNQNLATARFSGITFDAADTPPGSLSLSNCKLPNGQFLLGNPNYPAICYSGDRHVDRTQANSPSLADIREDLKILSAMGVRILRTYSSAEFPQSERILKVIRQLKLEDPKFEMYVMLGAWMNCKGAFTPQTDHSQEDEVWNKTEIDKAIELAHAYPEIVKIIAVGNEAMVHWQAHFVHPSVILKWVRYLKTARTEGRLPAGTLITTSDNWAALGGEPQYRNADLLELLRQLDYVSLHTYAFHGTHYDKSLQWGALPDEVNLPVDEQARRSIGRAIARQKQEFKAVERYLQESGIQKAIHIGETGWATRDNGLFSYEGTGAGDEYLSRLFYDAVREWTTTENLTCFYFEAFDEPWKSNGTDGSEGHFGLFTVDGQAKYALWNLVDQGVFKDLTRGGQPIVKTHKGDETAIRSKTRLPKVKAEPISSAIVPGQDSGGHLP